MSVEIRQWRPGMSKSEEHEVGLWERNMLALRYANYWTETKLMGYPCRALVVFHGVSNCLVLIDDEFQIGTLDEGDFGTRQIMGIMPLETEDPYAERNRLAEWHGDGWYYDDVLDPSHVSVSSSGMNFGGNLKPRFPGWRRVIACDNGEMNFHIPDEYKILDLPLVGLPKINRLYDGHTTEEKWRRVLKMRGIDL